MQLLENRGSPAKLVLCACGALFWELLLIRWQGSCIRIVAYYSNFILIAAFFGLGAGALLARRSDLRLERYLFVSLMSAVLLGVALGRFGHVNPLGQDEIVWLGTPIGVLTFSQSISRGLGVLPFWVLLGIVYVVDAVTFMIFGQWIGRMFRALPPLRGYSLEIAGSILGILGFAALSALHVGPVGWLAVGFAVVFFAQQRSLDTDLLAAACTVIALAICVPVAGQFIWSPYYKIDFNPITKLVDREKGLLEFQRPLGYTLEVNNDYHQMLLDLGPHSTEPEFLKSWRALYELPYDDASSLPSGPVLIVGAGTGNDVAAALRRTDRRVDAVEIDPVILDLGRRYHFERPYQNPRVHPVVDDARSFFQKSREKYALVVFGFLDSHTLLSSFSSLRLDNFVYTDEAMQAVRERLLPGGRVCLTFATTTPWMHRRFFKLLDKNFDLQTRVVRSKFDQYSNGVVYRNGRSIAELPRNPLPPAMSSVEVPTDDWPFLYLKSRTIPLHYRAFIAIVLLMGLGAMLLVPRGERQIRFPYFFMGAAFFLIETSNVVRLSLLYGSTWIVNVIVFTGILVLVLLGNLASVLVRRELGPLSAVFALLLASILAAYLTPTSLFLAIDQPLLRAVAVVLVYLSPVFFASVVFATLIRDEPDFYQAYGSNVLGAVLGGACEYLSLLIGFRALLLLTLGFYMIVFVLLARNRTRLAPGMG